MPERVALSARARGGARMITVCRQFLDQSLPKGWSPTQVEIRDIREPEISGEIADRPAINEVWTAIESKRVDLIVAEESSRLYRHPTKAGELFEASVDAGVRIICLSDSSRRCHHAGRLTGRLPRKCDTLRVEETRA
jgi:hypothetical protein